MEKTQAWEFCKYWLAAWSGNRPAELINFYHENIFYCDPAKPTGIQGKANLLHYLQKLLAKYPEWIWEAVEIFPYDTGFLLKWRAKVSARAEIFHGMDIIDIKDNKIIRNEVYFDPSILVKSLAQSTTK